MSEIVDAPSRSPAGVRPALRGWLHAGAAPAVAAAGLVLVVLSPSSMRVAVSVYAVTATLLFAISAAYHRLAWGRRGESVFKRLDHATIFLIIAGSYTPFALALLDPGTARTLLLVVWSGALLGAVFRVLWVEAPRWLYTPIYVALGWTAVFFLGDFARTAGTAVLVLIVVGGVLYSLGGLVYGLRRPDPSPRWFGFHEVFHAFTLGGWTVQHVAVWLAVLRIAT
ncbi:MAG: hemolysin III family protein [Candidatus Nanopelagicales bacterium]